MLANKQFVKDTMYAMYPQNFTNLGLDRRYWCDRAVDAAKRNLAFKFDTAEEARAAAEKLREHLAANGYTNRVKVTRSPADYVYRIAGGDYVRVQVMNE